MNKRWLICKAMAATQMLAIGTLYGKAQAQPDLVIPVNDYQLSLHAETPSIIRVQYGDLKNASRPAYQLVPVNSSVDVQKKETSDSVTLLTDAVMVTYSKKSGLLSFVDRASGKLLLAESIRKIQPLTRFGEKTFEVTQGFQTNPAEFISGTGWQQDDLVDFSGRYAYLCQWNTTSFVPFLQSNRGWAILWNNTSLTELNPAPAYLPIHPTVKEEAICEFTAPETGRYVFSLHRKTTEGFGELQLSVGDQILMSKNTAWAPMVHSCATALKKGEVYTVRARGNFTVSYNPPSARQQLVLRSEMAQKLDYHFIAGKTADERIKGYRMLTGAAPMFPRWAYGFFQSRERYHNEGQLMDAAKGFRQKNYPMDCMVQDWQYWGSHGWNAIGFDTTKFPDIDKTINELHGMNAQLMISVWPNFGDPIKGSKENLKTFGEKGWLLRRTPETATGAPPECVTQFYSGFVDMMNPEAGKALWDLMNQNMFQHGMDAWWLDATEPNLDGYQGGYRYYQTAQGPGAYWLNLYPMMQSKHVHDGQVATSRDKRVFILGRTGFAGIQRYGTTVWSGDTWSDWDSFSRQIVAGITASYSGIPYWCADIGGFAGLKNTNSSDQEMYTRWFQFGAFSPIFRAHGTTSPREPWVFGEKSAAVQAKYLNLRYRLLPYIYSEAAQITRNSGTLLRGLMMDFPNDQKACSSKASYMFGPAFLVTPITHSQRVLDRPGAIIPSTALFDKNKAVGGLSSSYYNGTEFDQFVASGKDAQINLQWNMVDDSKLEQKLDNKIEGLNKTLFSARWEGYIKITEPGDYIFSTAADDGARLWVDGRQLVDDWERHAVKVSQGKITFSKPGLVPVKLEYFQHLFSGALELRWEKLTDSTADATQDVYLPEGASWFNFWTGQRFEGGRTIATAAALDTLPLYVRAGSIIPLGPQMEWTGQKPAEPIELRIYPGADAMFTLYEDEGDQYNYEQGQFSTIDFNWDDARKTLTFSERRGAFPGMLKARTFKVVLVGKGDADQQAVASTIHYAGEKMVVSITD